MKVLIAEDDATSRIMLQETLEEWGYFPVVAQDGNEAWEIMQQDNSPRLMILDWMMPGIDGPELCRRIRNSSLSHYTYVILLTSRGAKQDLILGIDSGADAFLIKPVDLVELRSRLAAGKRVLEHQQSVSQRLQRLETKALPDVQQSASNVTIPPELLKLSRNLSHDQVLTAAPRIRCGQRLYPTLGKVVLLQRIGEGGMGTVYLGYNPRTQTKVAVKVLSSALLRGRADVVARFYREAHIAALVKSPNLVTVNEVDEEQGIVYLIMEFIDGLSATNCLRDAFRDGRDSLDEEEALELILAASKGLAAAHAHGIVHRDIKPDNILVPVGPDKRPRFQQARLADLGIARQELNDDGLTETNSSLGTAGFMAPEQIRDAKRAGKPADIFGMGVSLYMLLTGRLPFEGASTFNIYEDTIHKPHPSLRRFAPLVSEATESIIENCLAKDASARYPDAQALANDLEQALARLQQVQTKCAAVPENALDCYGQPLKQSA